MTKNITKVNLAVAAALAILISACSIANLGWLRNSPDVDRAFETLHVSSDYRYWYLYLENDPYAVLGLNPEYRIEDILWTDVESSSEVFRKVAGLVQSFPVPGSRTFGAYILDAKVICFWQHSDCRTTGFEPLFDAFRSNNRVQIVAGIDIAALASIGHRS